MAKEYIEREAVIRKIKCFAADVIFRGCKVIMTEEESCNPVEWTKGYEQGVKDTANLIAGQPAADVVEVVPELRKAVNLLHEEYERAKKLDFVYDPLAYAMYQVWKAVDGRRKDGR